MISAANLDVSSHMDEGPRRTGASLSKMGGQKGSSMAKELIYNGEQRKEYLNMIDRIGAGWLEVFQGNTDFYSAIYWDLLTQLWRQDGPVRKTDALKYMTAIKSPHTAGKYVQETIDHGLVLEEENPMDARSKLVKLAPDMRERLDSFFDGAVGEVRRTKKTIDVKGPSPEV